MFITIEIAITIRALEGFVSQDPIGLAGGISLYQYARNAVGWIDPLGLATRPPSPGAMQKDVERGQAPERLSEWIEGIFLTKSHTFTTLMGHLPT
ncbi:hypothetical protein BG58_09415 [Caballeronia jiangsuensis]|nr:hypothetical protein BG58_09415 [Caballeronia jiangsuensis]